MVNEDFSSSLNVNSSTFASKAALPTPACHEKDARKDGGLEFVSYTSSKLEKFFLEKLPEMNFPTERPDDPKPWGTGPLTEYCDFVMTYYPEILHWVTKLEVRRFFSPVVENCPCLRCVDACTCRCTAILELHCKVRNSKGGISYSVSVPMLCACIREHVDYQQLSCRTRGGVRTGPVAFFRNNTLLAGG